MPSPPPQEPNISIWVKLISMNKNISRFNTIGENVMHFVVHMRQISAIFFSCEIHRKEKILFIYNTH